MIFNFYLLNNKVNNNIKYFVDEMFTMSLFPLINKPMCISNQCHSIIDNIYTYSINKYITSSVIISVISDHFLFHRILQPDTDKTET